MQNQLKRDNAKFLSLHVHLYLYHLSEPI